MLHIKIITPIGLYHECDAESINACSSEGEFTLLSEHVPVVAMLKTSKMTIKTKDGVQDYAVSGGLLHLFENNINILVDAIEGKEEIDLQRAQEAKKRAEERLAKLSSATDLQRAEIALIKAINRIHVASGR